MIHLDWEDPIEDIGVLKTTNGRSVDVDRVSCPMCGAYMKLDGVDADLYALVEVAFRCPHCPTTTISKVESFYKRIKI